MRRTAIFLLLLVTLIAGCSRLPGQSEPAAQPADPSASKELPPSDVLLSGRPAEPVPRVTPLAGNWRLQIPDIKVDAEIVAVGLDPDGAMGSPEAPDVVGWYRYGPAPGEKGNALLDGHVDWTNQQTGVPFTGVFWDLSKLDHGDKVKVRDGDREFVYEVIDKKRYQFDDPAGVSLLQNTPGEARLTLITCGGTFNRATRSYDAREIVIARLAS